MLTAGVVEEDGFGPSKPKQQIYSLPPLTTRELLHMAAGSLHFVSVVAVWTAAGTAPLELADGFEPPTC